MNPIQRVCRFVADLDTRTSKTLEQSTGLVCDRRDANVITSEVTPGMHAPVLDIDFDARLIPSSTPGHYHLYLNKLLSWDQYRRLLTELAIAGIIEDGYAGASIEHGYSAVRKPGVYKPKAPEVPS